MSKTSEILDFLNQVTTSTHEQLEHEGMPLQPDNVIANYISQGEKLGFSPKSLYYVVLTRLGLDPRLP